MAVVSRCPTYHSTGQPKAGFAHSWLPVNSNVMPKILILTLAHITLAIVSGLALGLGVFGVGFSDSSTVRGTYDALIVLWQVLNAPAGIYVLQFSTPNWPLWGVIQLATSFFWANVFAIVASFWKVHRRA